MVPLQRVLTSRRLAVPALLAALAVVVACVIWPVYLFLGYSQASAPGYAVMSRDVPVACPGVPAWSLNLADHRSSLAPDGSTYIADWHHNVILRLIPGCGAIRVAGCNPEQVPPEPGSCQATTLPAPGIDVALDGPWGIDVAADGTVYIPDYQYAGGAAAGRILRLDPDGTLSSVADVAKPSQVKVGRNGKLFVATKDLSGASGINEVDLPSGVVTEIVSNVESEGIAVYENVATEESLLYAAVQIPALPGEGGGWHDAHVCVIDLQDPGPCEVIIRPSPYASGQPVVGPALGPVFEPPQPRYSRVADVEATTSGTLLLSHSLNDPFHSRGARKLMWGGNGPQVYFWPPGDTQAYRVFGYTMTLEDWYAAYWPCAEAIEGGTGGPTVSTYWGSSLSVGTSGRPLLSERECGFSVFLCPECERSPLDINYRTYEIQDVGAGDRLFLGADVASFALESLAEPPTADPYLAEDVVVSGDAYFVTDPATQILQSVLINGTYPGVAGGTAYVIVTLSRNGGSLVGSLLFNDSSVGFTHYHGPADVVVSSEGVAGNDIELEMESEDIGGGKGLFAVDIELRDGY